MLIDDIVRGIMYRPSYQDVQINSEGASTLGLLVENMGRLNFGGGMWDPKGITGVRLLFVPRYADR